ncbi:pyridoxamine 5'-phosphate oxidase [Geosmithia morbida]|uniref:pyridoxal 5'-phosphate synthase n=1 Tax=Geosmithia morbida TaxID=1094350 RepID=A0A9P4Z190_9HYPO|nr:pyridoxamine 5'-phosphate oxidase [Geosmithia morbida]KAF4126846.1 pyridoxamine 5'-phosphate oxidase [Geosmithia morbida]
MKVHVWLCSFLLFSFLIVVLFLFLFLLLFLFFLVPPPPLLLPFVFSPAGSQQHAQAGQFTLGRLTRSDLDASSPITQFHKWFSEAQRAVIRSGSADAAPETPAVSHPEACCLSTAELPSGRVSSRMVYLKELDSRGGFVVYTNLGTSRKAADLRTNPHASLLFFWDRLERQVRVEGRTERLTPAESQVYFDTRVRGSRVGAWASRQSQVLVPSAAAGTGGGGKAGEGKTGGGGEGGERDGDDDDGRAQLEGWVREAEERFSGQEHIPVPEFWGGLRLIPDSVEFWQGRNNRLHDRFLYSRVDGKDEWSLDRLSP